MKLWFFLICNCSFLAAFSQNDSSDVEAVRRMVNLSEVVVRSNLNVPAFLLRIKDDTSFYKAFRNLRIVGFTSYNDIRMLNKKQNVTASLQSKTRQIYQDSCRSMEVIEEKTSGDIYNKRHQWNYYTAQLYASLFFTDGKVCGQTNIVAGTERNIENKKGVDKHKEQLKMLFFNPGKKIPGIPFIGDKLDIFDARVARYYNYNIDIAEMNKQSCYVFTIKAKPGLTGSEKDQIVFDGITTWFNTNTMAIVARNYDLSYNAALYDFDVHMEVKMTQFDGMIVPNIIRYNGNWHVLFKKREHGVFTATLFDFTD